MPHLSFHIDDELYKRARKFIPWGIKSRVLRNLLEQLIERCEKEGPAAMADVASWLPDKERQR